MGRVLAVVALTAALLLVTVEPPYSGSRQAPALPSFKGLNYGVPLTQSGDWVGTAWLLDSHWAQVEPAIAADLDFVDQHHLGRVIRLFIGLDQLMTWDRAGDFTGFRPASLSHLASALDLFDTHHLRVILVAYDQEVVGSPGNFRFQALDGHHPAMRNGYIQAIGDFLRVIGGRSTVAGVDLFNEAYSSLGTAGHLPAPPAANPVSPGYPVDTVHQFLRDLYRSAKQTQPSVPLTVSDATIYWPAQPDLSLYDDVLDFYDVHVYDDHPELGHLRHSLDKPFIVGEAGAAVAGDHYADQAIEAGVVRSLLEQGVAAGAGAVLIHSIANQNVFSSAHDRLTPTGEILAQFTAPDGLAVSNSLSPVVFWLFLLLLFVILSVSGSLAIAINRRSRTLSLEGITMRSATRLGAGLGRLAFRRAGVGRDG